MGGLAPPCNIQDGWYRHCCIECNGTGSLDHCSYSSWLAVAKKEITVLRQVTLEFKQAEQAVHMEDAEVFVQLRLWAKTFQLAGKCGGFIP